MYSYWWIQSHGQVPSSAAATASVLSASKVHHHSVCFSRKRRAESHGVTPTWHPAGQPSHRTCCRCHPECFLLPSLCCCHCQKDRKVLRACWHRMHCLSSQKVLSIEIISISYDNTALTTGSIRDGTSTLLPQLYLFFSPLLSYQSIISVIRKTSLDTVQPRGSCMKTSWRNAALNLANWTEVTKLTHIIKHTTLMTTVEGRF